MCVCVPACVRVFVCVCVRACVRACVVRGRILHIVMFDRAIIYVRIFYHAMYETVYISIYIFLYVLFACLDTIDLYIRICALCVFL